MALPTTGGNPVEGAELAQMPVFALLQPCHLAAQARLLSVRLSPTGLYVSCVWLLFVVLGYMKVSCQDRILDGCTAFCSVATSRTLF